MKAKDLNYQVKQMRARISGSPLSKAQKKKFSKDKCLEYVDMATSPDDCDVVHVQLVALTNEFEKALAEQLQASDDPVGVGSSDENTDVPATEPTLDAKPAEAGEEESTEPVADGQSDQTDSPPVEPVVSGVADQVVAQQLQEQFAELQRYQREMANLRKQLMTAQARQVPAWFIKFIAPFGLNPANVKQDQLDLGLRKLRNQYDQLFDFYKTHKEDQRVENQQVQASNGSLPSRRRRMKMWLIKNRRKKVVTPLVVVIVILCVGYVVYQSIPKSSSNKSMTNNAGTKFDVKAPATEVKTTPQIKAVPFTETAKAELKLSIDKLWWEAYRQERQQLKERTSR